METDGGRLPLELRSRPVADDIEEVVGTSLHRERFTPADARSPSTFERVELEGDRCVIKYVHVDHDFAMRASGDIGCLPRRLWELGLMDVAPSSIDHAVRHVARWGRNGWGAAIVMRDVSDELVPVGDSPVAENVHLTFLDHIAEISAKTWGWRDDLGLLPQPRRWQWFAPGSLGGERDLGFPEPVPRIALEGWVRFADRVPSTIAEVVNDLHRDVRPLAEAIAATPTTFLHGDWKFGNLGHARDGRTVLIDWTYGGEGPVCHELAWYLALNRARLPIGHTKETTIDALRAALVRRGLDTDSWWDRQLALCLLGGLVQFGWEKAYGDQNELDWWIERALDGARWL